MHKFRCGQKMDEYWFGETWSGETWLGERWLGETWLGVCGAVMMYDGGQVRCG